MSRWDSHAGQTGPEWLLDALGRVFGYKDKVGNAYQLDARPVTGSPEALAAPGFSLVASPSANLVLTTQQAVFADATAGNLQITLPPANVGVWPITVFKTDASANTVTVVPASGTINGAASVVISAQNGGQTFYSNGSNWFAR